MGLQGTKMLFSKVSMSCPEASSSLHFGKILNAQVKREEWRLIYNPVSGILSPSWRRTANFIAGFKLTTVQFDLRIYFSFLGKNIPINPQN